MSEEAAGLLGCKVRKDREVLKAVGRRRHPRREQSIKLREVEMSQGLVACNANGCPLANASRTRTEIATEPATTPVNAHSESIVGQLPRLGSRIQNNIIKLTTCKVVSQ